jgi:hypothetical protein
VLECNAGTGEVTFNADGTVTSRATGENVRVRMSNGSVMHIVHELTEGHANWSTDHGEIEFCDARTTMTGMTTITASNGSSRQAPINETTPASSGGASYVCTPTTLTITTHDAPGAFLGAGPEMVLQRRH